MYPTESIKVSKELTGEEALEILIRDADLPAPPYTQDAYKDDYAIYIPGAGKNDILIYIRKGKGKMSITDATRPKGALKNIAKEAIIDTVTDGWSMIFRNNTVNKELWKHIVSECKRLFEI